MEGDDDIELEDELKSPPDELLESPVAEVVVVDLLESAESLDA